MKTKNQRRARSNADFLFSFAPPRRRRGRDVGAPPARRNPGERGIPARAPRISFPVFRTCNVGNCLNALLCSHGSCSKSFWDSPLVEGPARQVHPKTTTFCLVLGFTPSTQPSRAHQSQNDFEQRYSAPSLALPGSLCGTFRPVSPSRFSGLIYCMQCLYGNRGRISGHSDRR